MYRLKNKLTLLTVAMLGILLAGCGSKDTGNGTGSNSDKTSRVEVLPFYNSPDFTPRWIAEGSDSLEGFHQIRPFNLINQNGSHLTEKDFAGKIYVADFFFTSCPGICPKMTKNMLLLQEAFQDDEEVLLISHSVTPESDSVPVLRGYADLNDVQDGKWHLVTGERAEIYDLGRNEYFVEENMGVEKSDNDFLHTENFVLVDKDRHIRGIFNGLNKGEINQLIADIKTLKNSGKS